MFNIKNHPRPDFSRKKFLVLDGIWDFSFDNNDAFVFPSQVDFNNKIQVPYPYQSELSGLGTDEKVKTVWYKKEFEIISNAQRVLLNFGAVDYYCEVFVNDKFVRNHTGGYSSFNCDITDFLVNGENVLCLKVIDEFENKNYPRGKQTWTNIKPFGCVYTEYTGIWQSVWLEFVSDQRVNHFIIKPDAFNKKVDFDLKLNKAIGCDLKTLIYFNEKLIKQSVISVNNLNEKFSLDIYNSLLPWEGVALWSPDAPNLYNVIFELIKDDKLLDSVSSYFGVRNIETKGDKILINNFPIYQKLLLNQGYFPKGLITPDTNERFAEDVKLIKQMGFNGIRIHEKIENPLFLYECDKQGLLVWEEMPSAYNFSNEAISDITAQWQEIILRDINHPSIITWVTINESWGTFEIRHNKAQQAFSKALYNLTKAIDTTRLVVENDGWEHTETDICTIHDYISDGDKLLEYYKDKQTLVESMPSPLFPRYVFADDYKYSGQPIIISEYGGIAFSDSDGWGYDGKVNDVNEFIQRVKKLTQAIKQLPYICGYCYTQFTDIEAEQNGLLYMDRTPKIDIEEIAKINNSPQKWL